MTSVNITPASSPLSIQVQGERVLIGLLDQLDSDEETQALNELNGLLTIFNGIPIPQSAATYKTYLRKAPLGKREDVILFNRESFIASYLLLLMTIYKIPQSFRIQLLSGTKSSQRFRLEKGVRVGN